MEISVDTTPTIESRDKNTLENYNKTKKKEKEENKKEDNTRHAHNLSKGYEHKSISIINYNLLGCEYDLTKI